MTTKEARKETREKYARKEGDCGSPEVLPPGTAASIDD